MDRQLDHMVRLIDDLLDLSRISRGSLDLKKEKIDVESTIATAIENARPFFERRQQELIADLAKGVFANADATRLVQIVTNLLHNAAKFSPSGAKTTVQLLSQGTNALIKVADAGLGLAGDQLERVFDMFARVERPGVTAEPGLGIGLALARRLAHLHEGTLTASSDGEGRGSTFTLTLPTIYEQLPAADSGGQAKNGTPADAAVPLAVLVVEDNVDVGDTLGLLLEDLGHRVWLARNGQNGVALVQQRQPDVVFCDLGLPGMDGLEVCRQVRALSLDVQPIMVAVTGWGRADDLRRTKEAGFDHHLVKPIPMARLYAILEASVQRAQRIPRTG
jgi:CheY-like chemotaxis protein/two-component sensor histidine kinase